MTDWKSVARAAPYNLATELEECPFQRFWVVQLAGDAGLACEVYQTEPSLASDIPNPWLRLKRLCADFDDLQIVNMAYVDRQGKAQQVNLLPNAPGYFYSKRMRKLFNAGPYAFQDEAEGVGFMDGEDHLVVYWTFTDGRQEMERRPLKSANAKQTGLAGLIRS